MPIPYIPLEIKALIIQELFDGLECRCPYHRMSVYTLSALSFAWPDTIPLIRECRFKRISLRQDNLASLLAILNSAPEIYDLIRSISQERDTILVDSVGIIRRAVKVEELNLYSVDLPGFNRTVAELPGALRGCTRLTNLTIHDNIVCLPTIFETIHFLPYLTTLDFWSIYADDLRQALSPIWLPPNNYNPEDFLEMWDPHNYEAPNSVIQITSLSIDWESREDLQFLDLIASPRTPFPNIQQIKLAGKAGLIYRTERLHVLLERYKNSLRSLELDINDNFGMPILTLPSALEHFKFSARAVTSLEPFARTLL